MNTLRIFNGDNVIKANGLKLKNEISDVKNSDKWKIRFTCLKIIWKLKVSVRILNNYLRNLAIVEFSIFRWTFFFFYKLVRKLDIKNSVHRIFDLEATPIWEKSFHCCLEDTNKVFCTVCSIIYKIHSSLKQYNIIKVNDDSLKMEESP